VIHYQSKQSTLARKENNCHTSSPALKLRQFDLTLFPMKLGYLSNYNKLKHVLDFFYDHFSCCKH